ncbi:arylsulfatase [Niabella terrae]
MIKTFFCWICFGLLIAGTGYAQKAPNIIVIVADDLGWGDLGFHNSEIKTPHIDGLARDGVVLDRFYVAPICSPTRAGIMTGRYPDRLGLRDNVIAPWLNFGIDTAEQYIPELLATAGYRNRAAIGKWHLGHARKAYLPLNRGFTHFYGHYNGAIDYFTHEREGELDWHNDWESSYDKGYSTDLVSKEAVRCVRAYKKDGPFFLYIAYNAPHGPLEAKQEDLLRYGYDSTQPSFGSGDSKGQGRGNTKRQTYAAMVSSMDQGIGQILAALKEEGLEDNTLVLFQSDNGAATNIGGSSGQLRGAKFQEWEGGVRAAAVIRWPAGFAGGWVSEQLCGYVDLLPTICAAAGVKKLPARKIDGMNILPSLKNHEAISRAFYLGHGALIKDNWKLVQAGGGNESMKLKHDMLFDILKDPFEKEDLRTREPEAYQRFKKLVQPYQAITSDVQVPPYGQGRKTFKAPREWRIDE